MDEAKIEKLIKDVKNDLDITWDDDGTDAKVREAVMFGINKFDEKSEIKNDYSIEGSMARLLLFKFCLYYYSNKANDFELNYIRELTDFINDARIRILEDSKNDNDSL